MRRREQTFAEALTRLGLENSCFLNVMKKSFDGELKNYCCRFSGNEFSLKALFLRPTKCLSLLSFFLGFGRFWGQ